MASRSSKYKPSDSSKLEEDEKVVAFDKKPEYTFTKKSVIRSVLNARIRLPGPVSGKMYEWPKAGSEVDVLQEDVAGFLAKRIGEGSCCGNSPDRNKIFELVV